MSRVFNNFGNILTPSNAVRINNNAGFGAFERSLEERYVQMLMTNTFGNTFYQTKDELIDEASQLHAEMSLKDPEFMAKAISYARNKGYMRSQPLYGLAVLSSLKDSMFEQIFDKVVLTPNDLRDFMIFIKSCGRGQGGRKIKRVAGNWFASKMNEYWLIKYGSEGKKGYSLKDLMITLHPKGMNADFAKYLIHNDLVELSVYNKTDVPKIDSFLKLKKSETEEEIIKYIKEGRLPHEVITSSLKIPLTPKIWEEIVYQMPVFALLKNLATLERNTNLNFDLMHHIKSILNNSQIIAISKILPFRFLDAFEKVNNPYLQDILRQGLDRAFSNIPEIKGKTVVMLDISGSMEGQYIRNASIFAFSLLKKMQDQARLIVFDDRAEDYSFSQYDSILSQALNMRTRGGTDTGEPIAKILHEKYRADNIILISDEQQNQGCPFFNILGQYRQKINENVKTFIINIASTTGSLCPNFKNIFYLYGWSDQILNAISFESQGYNGMIEEIRRLNNG